MRFFQLLVPAWFCLSLSVAVAQSGIAPGDLYFDGFRAWQSGEKLEQEGNKQAALQNFLEAHKLIKSVAQNYPDWQPDVVGYRLKNVEQSLTRLGYAVPPSSSVPAVPSLPATVPGQPVPVVPGASAPAPGVTNPLDIINGQFKALQQQNAAKDAQLNDMAAKMKGYEAYYLEALKAQQTAEKDRDALIQKMGTLNSQLSLLTKDTGAKDAAAQAEIQRLRTESKTVSDLLASRAKEFNDSAKTIENLKKERDDLLVTKKQLEDDLVKARSMPAVPVPDDVGKVMAENARLKMDLESAHKQIETLKAEGGKKDDQIASLKAQITGIQKEIATLRQDNTAYQTQVAELTVKLKEMNSDLQNPANKKPDSQLAKENETLRAIIMRHLRQQQRLLASKEMVIAEMKKLEVTSQSLMENLEDMTSGKVRITVDEEPLFTDPELKVIIASKGSGNSTLEATTTNKSKSASKKPAGPAPGLAPVASAPTKGAGTPAAAPTTSITPEERLMVQADQALQSQDFKAAETALQDVLRANPKNTAALINLADIKRTEKKQNEAEVLLQKCLVYEPANATALYWLGVCQFQQNRLPDALASFEKCVQNDKKNARAHHYLGIISSNMTNRRRAEAEFKSALAIDPEYGDAYFNLAVLYATATPPEMDKAREHYQNALRRGIHSDPTLEKLLDPQGNPAPKEKTASN